MSAFHLLLAASLPEPVASGTVLGRLQLRYLDGGETVIPLRAGHELPGFAGEDADVPQVFPANPSMAGTGLPDLPLSAPRLDNPEPGRPLRCLGLDAYQFERPLLLLGITLEAAPATAAATVRVIAAPEASSKL
jgi:hypothetical protein